MTTALVGLAAACLLLGVLLPLHQDRLLRPATAVLTQGHEYARQFRPPPAPVLTVADDTDPSVVPPATEVEESQP